MGRRNGESITANKVTSKHTNVTEKNQRPVFIVHCTLHSTSTHLPTCLEARLPVHCAQK